MTVMAVVLVEAGVDTGEGDPSLRTYSEPRSIE
jgi:hypothetical protein